MVKIKIFLISIVIILGVIALVAIFSYSPPKVVSIERVGEPQTLNVIQSCTKPGMCYTCMPGFDGKLKCGVKFSQFCSSGKRKVTIIETPVRVYYNDGSIKKDIQEQIIESGPCK